MCNLYTYKLSCDEIRGLMQHYKLIGQQWAEVFEKEMAGKNDEALVYPKYQAPVVIVRNGERTAVRELHLASLGLVFHFPAGKAETTSTSAAVQPGQIIAARGADK